jgi:transcriptional regulator with XRE-family HTH domain
MPSAIRTAKLLGLLRQMADAHGTNAYQIAKASGVTLGSVQNLLAGKAHPTLRNLEAVFAVLGCEIQVVRRGKPSVSPGTGRLHGPIPGKRWNRKDS